MSDRGRFLLSWLGLTLLAASAVAQEPASPRVALVRPAPGTALVGEVELAFLVTGVDDAEIAEATIHLDGKTVARLDSPPWNATVDAGDEIEPHRVDVVVRLRSGRTLTTGRTYETPPGMERVDVRLVNLAVTVTDRRGNPVLGLGRENFAILDEGEPVAIERWEGPPDSIAVALVIDTSGSMRGSRLDAARDAAAEFVQELAERDRVAVLSFSDRVETLVALTDDHAAATAALRGLDGGGGTALYDALARGARLLAEQTEPGARRALVLLSDGRDESASGLEPGSFHTLREAIRAAHATDVQVYALGVGSQLEIEQDFEGRATTAEILTTISRSTGGSYRPVRSIRWLGRAFGDILDELRSQYSLAYKPPDPRPGETFREIAVDVDLPGAEVRTREGYYIDRRN